MTSDTSNETPEPLGDTDDIFRQRRRRELARELQDELDARGCRALESLVPSPTNQLEHAPVYKTCRGKSSPGHSCISQLYRLMLDLAVDGKNPAADVQTIAAEVQAVATLLLDRVVGIGSPPEVQQALNLEAEAGAEDDVVSIEALSDGEICAEDRHRMIRAARRAEVGARAKRRALELYDPEAA